MLFKFQPSFLEMLAFLYAISVYLDHYGQTQ